MSSSACVAAMGALLAVAPGCAQVSGLNDFHLDGNGGSPAEGGGSADGGAGGNAGGSSGGGGSGGQAIAKEPFGTPTPVKVLNTDDDEDDPTFTADGLELYFNTNRSGQLAIWRSVRASVDDDWGEPEPVSEIDPNLDPTNPVVAPDGLTLWFDANAMGKQNYVTTRSSRSATWSTPMVDGTQMDSSFGVVGAVSDDLRIMLLFDDNTLYEARRVRQTAPWDAPEPIKDVGAGREPWLSPDGLHMYWWNDLRIVRSSRDTLDAPFGAPEQVSELAVEECPVGDPWLAPDQSYVMFAVGESPDRDIYEARRAPP